MSAEDIKKEEERIMKSLNRATNPTLKAKEEAERRRKQEERKKKEEEDRKAAEERRKEELRKKEEARVKTLEEEQARGASATSSAANPYVDNTSIVEGIFNPQEDEARLKREEEKMAKMFGISGGGKTASSTNVTQTSTSQWEGDKSAAEREEERMRKQFGIKTPQPGVGSLPHSNKTVEGETNAEISKPPEPPVYIKGQPVVPQGPASVGTVFETDVWSELNKIRMNPSHYVAVLRELEKQYSADGLTYTVPGTDAVRKTKEGVSALFDAIKFLEQAKPCEVLELSPIFSKSAMDLVDDKAASGDIETKLKDGTTPAVRLLRYGVWKKKVAEILSFGAVSGKDAAQQLLLDDGNPARTNRLALMDPSFKVLGVSSGYHPRHHRMTDVVLAADFKAAETHIDNRVATSSATSFSASDKELNIANFVMGPHGNSANVELDVGEARAFVQVKILPSKYGAEIAVNVKGDNLLEVVSKHVDEQGNHVSATNKVTLQTVINAKTFSVLSQKPDGITIRITKTFFK
eukprot:TRINITY_DN8413_c0_g1_i1.p1 TRINITY_DN8413_c0_g1~~TRINITY_DN8413_c0_g1_i1.p1  ORF type:complete len:521 (+),score=190.76 TRINITY_DN8413_c0_g1_i1:132-1694(+)